MATKSAMAFIGVLALTMGATASSSEHKRPNSDAAGITPSVVLVRVQTLKGKDNKQTERVLFQNARGVLVPLTDIQNIGRYLRAEPSQAPAGAYHDLKVQLADEVHIYGSPSGPVHTRLSADGAPQMLGLLGTVLITQDDVRPLALAPNRDMNAENPRDMGKLPGDRDDDHIDEDEDEEDD